MIERQDRRIISDCIKYLRRIPKPQQVLYFCGEMGGFHYVEYRNSGPRADPPDFPHTRANETSIFLGGRL